MSDCVLPVTGSNVLLVALVAFLALGSGLALAFGVRRRGLDGGAAVVIAFALAAGGAVVSDARRADAQDCSPATTPGASGTPTAESTTTAAATTASSTSTTAATTTSPPTTPQVFPTTPTTIATTTTSSTTTTIGVPDLTPSVGGQSTQQVFTNPWLYTIRIDNLGTAPTDGSQMTFTVSLPASPVRNGALVDYREDITPSNPDWTVEEFPGTPNAPGKPGTATTLTFTSTPDFVIGPAPGTSTVTLVLDFLADGPGEFSIDVTLPPGIGGETNAANNTTSLPVDVVDPLPPG